MTSDAGLVKIDFLMQTSETRILTSHSSENFFKITIYEKLVVPTVRSVALQTMSSENNRYGGTKSQQYSTSTAVWGNFGGGL